MKKGGNAKSNSRNQADWVKFDFVNINLSETDKADFKAKLSKDPQGFLAELDALCKSGYKVSVNWDGSNNCAIASLTCKEALDPNFNYVLTARAGDIWESLSLVMYKHLYMCDDGDWAADERSSSSGWG